MNMVLSPLSIEETDKLIDQLEEIIVREHTFFEKLILFSKIGMVVLSKDTAQFIFANPAACKIFGRKVDDLQQTTLDAITNIEFLNENANNSFADFLNSIESEHIHTRLIKLSIQLPNKQTKTAFMEIIDIMDDSDYASSSHVIGYITESSQLKQWLKSEIKRD